MLPDKLEERHGPQGKDGNAEAIDARDEGGEQHLPKTEKIVEQEPLVQKQSHPAK